ncbi:unnamed protein product [Kluyveromyces dobzhanskii CBS 2104]|uniref:non-specific serine/threonine protein kinase n=1 Tax=Kluyveromyces dobzhanskii CBS 2104 TaxID=1427455 RepID=A0A0A8KZY1_9SACH|nr:unnamed protein product [Kluyveromyces dobzhanskii CBS 2104]
MTQSGFKSMIPEDIRSSTPSSDRVAQDMLHKRDKIQERVATSSEVEGSGSHANAASGSGRSSKRPSGPDGSVGNGAAARAAGPAASSKQEKPVETHSKNPLKKIFGRSKSHHVDQGKGLVSSNPFLSGNDIRPRMSPKLEGKHRSRGASLLHKDKDKEKEREMGATTNMHVIKSSSAIPSLASHNTNPFLNSANGKIPLESLNIPHRPPTVSQLYHSPSSASATPSSTSLGFYQTEGDSKGENVLPLPLKNPNDFLPESMQQPSVMLTDNFAFVDSGRKTIGEGGSSQVMTVYSLYRRKQVYALKRFKLFKDETPDHFYHRCVTEFIIANKVSNHVNIVKTYYLMKTPSISNGPKRSWAFLMQQCVQDMFHYTVLSGWASKPLDEKWCCFKQIARGIRHMHSLGIAHRDIKLENVLVTDYGALKLTDFGISTYGVEDPEDPTSKRIKIKGYCGSPPHVPPEVMILSEKKKKIIPVPKDKEEYDPFLMDTWALGVLMFNLVCPFALFGEAHKDDSKYRHYVAFHEQFCKHSPHFKKPGVYRSGPGAEHPDFSKLGSVEASRVCLRLMDPDPSTRYTIEDLFNDPWMAKIEMCFDEDEEEPIKVPELRKATSDDDPIPHDIPSTGSSFNDEHWSGTHSTNPFLDFGLKSPKIKSKSMLFIAEEEANRRSASSSVQGSPKVAFTGDPLGTTLPTLDEEKTKDVDDDEKGISSPKAVSQENPIPVSATEPGHILNSSPSVESTQPKELLKKMSTLSLNSNPAYDSNITNDSNNTSKSEPSSAPISRSSSVVSKNSVTAQSNPATLVARKRKKHIFHHHSECGGKPMFSLK